MNSSTDQISDVKCDTNNLHDTTYTNYRIDRIKVFVETDDMIIFNNVAMVYNEIEF